MAKPKYRLYLDESGDHADPKGNQSIGRRYLGLVGVAIRQERPYRTFAENLENIKARHLPEHEIDNPAILHRTEIQRRVGHFAVLANETVRNAFDDDIVRLIKVSRFVVIAVVIDKETHGNAAYRTLQHPYHYCLHAMLERYCGYLRYFGFCGDVMAESRGSTEDGALKEAYRHVWTNGTRYDRNCREQLTSKELKIKGKDHNIAGLQLADVLAHPVTRDVLLNMGRIGSVDGDFAKRVVEACQNKYNSQLNTGRIDGYGRVLLT